MSVKFNSHKATNLHLDSVTRQQVEDFHRQMAEAARFNRNLTLVLAASQIRRLKRERQRGSPPRRRMALFALPLIISRLVLQLLLKLISLLIRNKGHKPEMNMGTSSQEPRVIIDVFPDGGPASDEATVYRPYRYTFSSIENKRSNRDETDG